MGRTVTVYYTFEGNSGFVAEEIARNIPADTERLIPKTEPPKKGLMKFIHGGGSALKNELAELVPLTAELSDYDTVVIAFPIWAGTYPPAIGTFLKDERLAGKRIYAVASSMSGRADRAFSKIASQLGKTELDGTLSLVSPLKNSRKAAEQIADFCKGLE